MNRLSLAFVLLAVPAGCRASGSPEPSRQVAEQPVDQLGTAALCIRETLFRHLFEHNASMVQSGAGYYFLSVGPDGDPSAELLSRFDAHTPEVLPVSASVGGASGVRHVDNGTTGLLFCVGQIRWINEAAVEVSGSWWETGLCASGATYRLELHDDAWAVTTSRGHWIS